MNDLEIRKNFHQRVLQKYHSSCHARVLDELGLMHGACRADIAVVNGRMVGYEIKSDEDSLSRLKKQVIAYNAVFDNITIIVGERHHPSITRYIPKYWGIVISKKGKRGAIHFHIQRKSKSNPNVDAVSVARLLWRDEAVEILKGMKVTANLLKSPRAKLYDHLSQHLALTKLKSLVRGYLKKRANWRDRTQLSPNDDLCLPISKLSNSPGFLYQSHIRQ